MHQHNECDITFMFEHVQGNALKIQVAYLVADIVTACGIWTCDVIARTDCARSLRTVDRSVLDQDLYLD